MYPRTRTQQMYHKAQICVCMCVYVRRLTGNCTGRSNRWVDRETGLDRIKGRLIDTHTHPETEACNSCILKSMRIKHVAITRGRHEGVRGDDTPQNKGGHDSTPRHADTEMARGRLDSKILLLQKVRYVMGREPKSDKCKCDCEYCQYE